MAGDGEEETEYESDPEEVKMSLKMRRREASDDEEEEEGEEEEKGEGDGEERREMTSARASDAESDGQGGAAEYDDEELEEEEEYYDEYEEEEEEELVAVGEYVDNGGEAGVRARGESDATEAIGRDEEVGDSNEGHVPDGEEQVGEEGEKKENEPFMVPTAGAFYMHDDRFREALGGRNRRTFAGRKLWESKDDKKWGHDKFEEMNTRERPYDEGRKSSRGRSRGRGRGRGGDRGYVRGARPRSYSENSDNSNISNANNTNNVAPKTVRGRGPRRYQALTKVKSEGPRPPNKQSQKPLDKASYGNSRRSDASAEHMDSGPMLAKRVASNLNSASPPFYPSGTSKKDSTVNQKRDDQTANGNRNSHSHIHDGLSVQQSNSSIRGKNVVGSVGMDKLYIDDPSLARPMGNMHLQSASMSTNPPQSKGQGRAVPFSGPNSFQSSPSQNQSSKISSAAQTHSGQRNHAQGRGQASFPVSSQQLGQQPASASQSSSPPHSGLSITQLDSGDADLAESSKSKTALVAKGKGTTHGSGRGSFLYSGIQVMGSGGAMGAGHGDQNFSGTPAFLPVMQFGAQHPGGMGVPAVGMAFPGYVAQPQLGMGNSEMTWLPFLTGAGGALGPSYCPPYVAVDGSYHARPTGQTPALPASSKDNSVSKPNNEGKSQQKSDTVNDEFSQRQKPRRYSEMNFGQ
ncbi:hypothetical protein V2J09_005448 [Rumex salicifolius]